MSTSLSDSSVESRHSLVLTQNSIELTHSEGEVLDRLRQGGEVELGKFFEGLRADLHRLLKFRIDQRLKRRLDGSDIIQEAYLESCRRLEGYLKNPIIPPSAWVRRLVRQALSRVQRDHLQSQRRDVRRETEADHLVTSVDIAELSASMTPPDARAQQGDAREKLFKVLSRMPALESEILTLVHCEARTLREAAAELNINLEAAKKRYRRAILRLKGSIDSESQIM